MLDDECELSSKPKLRLSLLLSLVGGIVSGLCIVSLNSLLENYYIQKFGQTHEGVKQLALLLTISWMFLGVVASVFFILHYRRRHGPNESFLDATFLFVTGVTIPVAFETLWIENKALLCSLIFLLMVTFFALVTLCRLDRSDNEDHERIEEDKEKYFLLESGEYAYDESQIL